MATAVNSSAQAPAWDAFMRLEKRHGPDSQGWYRARCPAHDDRNPSLGFSLDESGTISFVCHANCEKSAIIEAMGVRMADTFAPRPQSDRVGSSQPMGGCTLAAFAQLKRLPMAFLHDEGLADLPGGNGYNAAIRIPYYDTNKLIVLSTQLRINLHKAADGRDNRFRFVKGSKAIPYGQWRLVDARQRGYITLVEGTSDALTLWFQGEPALGFPGADNWKDERDAPLLDDVPTIYVVIEPDAGGEGVKKWLATSRLRDRVRVIVMSKATKDPSALYLADPYAFSAKWGELRAAAQPWQNFANSQRSRTTGEGDTTSGPWRPNPTSMRELMAKQLPPIRWAVTDLIAEGLTLLGAKPKKGKTVMMLNIGWSVSIGALALGRFMTTKSEALYIALEDNERRMQKRMRQMLNRETPPADFHVVYEWPPLDAGGITALDQYIDEHPATGLVIVDTLEHVRAKRRANGSVYAEDYAAVRALQQWAGKRQVAVVAITHLRKAPADDPFDEISGSTGLSGGVDNMLVMRSNQSITELHRRGRDYEDDTTLALKGDRERLTWTVEGAASDLLRSAERKRIIDAITEAAADGIGIVDLVRKTNMKRNNVDQLLHKLVNEKQPLIKSPHRGMYVALEFLIAYEQAHKASDKKSGDASPHKSSNVTPIRPDLTDLTDLTGEEADVDATHDVPSPDKSDKSDKIQAESARDAANQADSMSHAHLTADLSSCDVGKMGEREDDSWRS